MLFSAGGEHTWQLNHGPASPRLSSGISRPHLQPQREGRERGGNGLEVAAGEWLGRSQAFPPAALAPAFPGRTWEGAGSTAGKGSAGAPTGLGSNPALDL